MKTAIVYTGHVRSFDRCFANHWWEVLRHFPGADVFFSTVNDADKPKIDAARWRFSNIRIDGVDEQPDCITELRERGAKLPDEWTRGKPYTHEPFAISVHPQAVARQLWQLQRTWDAFPLDDYDMIIRIRPDLWFGSFELPRSFCVDDDTAMVPYWGSFGGINDRLALLGQRAARVYFTTYGAITALMDEGCPFHPESLIAARLEFGGIRVRRCLETEFGTLRTTGEMRPPEISASDLARKFANSP